MQNSYFPKYDLASRIEHTKFDSGMGGIMPKSIRLEGVEAPETQNFKQVFTGIIENLNAQIQGHFIKHVRGKDMEHLIYKLAKEKN